MDSGYFVVVSLMKDGKGAVASSSCSVVSDDNKITREYVIAAATVAAEGITIPKVK
jgi:hypothetical protein